jgi:hypothetical protein
MLPTYMDVAVVLFQATPIMLEGPFMDFMDVEAPMETVMNIPQWEDCAADLAGPTTASFACIVGRTLGGVVTAKIGQVEVTQIDPEEPLGGRSLAFYLDCAEPEDSGTLLFSYDQAGNPKVLGIFRGL